VLVVDDDGDWRELVAEALADEGFVVATACDGRSACQCLRHLKPEVVVTDVEMPGMDGHQLLTHLHLLDPTLPVIVLSAGNAQAGSSFTGAFRFMRKPVTTDAVAAAVKEALSCRPRTRLRQLWSAARGAAGAARARGYAVCMATMNRWHRSASRILRIALDRRAGWSA
jgi:DNA-binding NtrC family response regulator